MTLAPEKGAKRPPCCGQSTILQLFFFKLSLAKSTLRKKTPKTQNAYSAKHSRAVARARISSKKDLETLNFQDPPDQKTLKIRQNAAQKCIFTKSSRELLVFSGPANVDDPYKTRVSLEFWPLGRLALTEKCLQTHGPVQAPSPSTIAHALFLERVRNKLIQHVVAMLVGWSALQRPGPGRLI